MVVSTTCGSTPTAATGWVEKYQGCKVRTGWSKKAYRATKDRQWRLNDLLEDSECTVGARHLSGVTRTHYKGTRVVAFKYRLDYLRSC